jgi:serine O-acetyltransferase
MKNREIQQRLAEYTDRLVSTYNDELPQAHSLDRNTRLPSQEKTFEILEKLFEVLYPGFVGSQHLTRGNVAYHIGALLDDIADGLDEQVYLAIRSECPGNEPCAHCSEFAEKTVDAFLAALPGVRRLLTLDVQAALDGDPAAKSFAEIILAYPGLEAISVYRVAHVLYGLGVPLLPRIMTEWAHRRTGVDIGETTEIGANVKVYQGVTLGALSFPKDERGELIRGRKRHPTIEDEVVIYAGATILGGSTVVGRGSVIGGNTWLIHSVPPRSRVISDPQEQRIEPGDAPR